jgi:hypothetical protein
MKRKAIKHGKARIERNIRKEKYCDTPFDVTSKESA